MPASDSQSKEYGLCSDPAPPRCHSDFRARQERPDESRGLRPRCHLPPTGRQTKSETSRSAADAGGKRRCERAWRPPPGGERDGEDEPCALNLKWTNSRPKSFWLEARPKPMQVTALTGWP